MAGSIFILDENDKLIELKALPVPVTWVYELFKSNTIDF